MTTIAEAHASSTAPPSAFFACCGPLGWLWTRALGKGAAASLAPDLAGLVAAAEARHAAAATA